MNYTILKNCSLFSILATEIFGNKERIERQVHTEMYGEEYIEFTRYKERDFLYTRITIEEIIPRADFVDDLKKGIDEVNAKIKSLNIRALPVYMPTIRLAEEWKQIYVFNVYKKINLSRERVLVQNTMKGKVSRNAINNPCHYLINGRVHLIDVEGENDIPLKTTDVAKELIATFIRETS